MMTRPDRSPRLRVVAIADADSFVKWSAALVDSIPDASRHLLLVRTPLLVSADQEHAALAGTGFTEGSVTRLEYDGLAAWLARDRPDVVVISGRGPFVRVVQRQIDRVHPRPVVVTGLPGMSIPAQRGALLYRRHSDLMVVHSRREMRAFDELGRRLGAPVNLALATLPYARRKDAGSSGTDLVFAAQAIVPRAAEDRRAIADLLRRAALADPDRRVVVKLRSRPERGETEAHQELSRYPELLHDRPANLVFSYEPMAEALTRAEGLVTISSTAAIEAMARGIPVIALDMFGVKKAHLNTVFAGSGVFGGAEDVIARRFRHPHPLWMRDNYFHDPAESTCWGQVHDLVARRRYGQLPARPIPQPRGGPLHLAWQRKSVLGADDHTLAGAVAVAVAAPVVRAILTLRRFRGRNGAMTWSDDTTDFTVSPARHQDPIVRRRQTALVAVD
ncbi:DUF6716 putative glycosyltransferase [Microbacterium invictum]|uniref:Uncharacterized protein n=1 Tax=Microbacterium invictum TaxID=515415 RepID=A0AA40SQU5_9MICO|nr:DUF6716 putative glycosyltransferase [Microbacterium invictum]MBB4140634.1 hypothetical protein [Microbacterium invictum]